MSNRLWNWFSAVDTDRSGAITAPELERALINGDWTPFDLDTVKLLMSIFDTDRSGTIGFNEFAGLWKYIKDWQNVFRHFDRDRSGSIDGQELSEALGQFGYRLSPQLLDLVQKKYGESVLLARHKRRLLTSLPAGQMLKPLPTLLVPRPLVCLALQVLEVLVCITLSPPLPWCSFSFRHILRPLCPRLCCR